MLKYGKSSNKCPPSFKCLPPIHAPPKIRKSFWTPPSFKCPLLINAPSPLRRVFIRKMVTYLFKPILSVWSRNQLDIIICRVQLQVKHSECSKKSFWLMFYFKWCEHFTSFSTFCIKYFCSSFIFCMCHECCKYN